MVALVALLALASCEEGTFDDTPAIILEPIAEWGEPGAPPFQQFGSILAFTADSSGTVYVFDAQSDSVKAIDLSGRLLWSTGGSGDGPGEYKEVTDAAVGFGSVFASDGYAARLAVLSAVTGEVQSTLNYGEFNRGMYMNGEARVLGPDRVSFGSLAVFSHADSTYPSELAIEERLVTVDVAAGVHDAVPVPGRREDLFVYEKPSGRKGSYKLPFSPWRVWAVNPGGGATVAWGAEYSITELGPNRDTVRKLGRPVPPRRATGEAITAAHNFKIQALKRDLGVARASEAPMPRVQQQITALYYSRSGRSLWVRRGQWEPAPVYDVFGPGGYLCTVALRAPGGVSDNPLLRAQIVGGRVFQHFSDERLDIRFIAAFDIPTRCRG